MIIKKLKLRFQKIYWLFMLFLLFLPIISVFAIAKNPLPAGKITTSSNCEVGQLCNPIKGVDSIEQFLNTLLQAVVKIATPIVVLMIVYSGFLFIKAQGNPEELKTAKKAIMWTVIGAIVVLGAFALSEAIKGTVDDLKEGIVNSSYIIELG